MARLDNGHGVHREQICHECLHTMLSRQQGLFSILGVSVGLATDNDHVDVRIGEELRGSSIVFGRGVVDRAVRARLGRLWVLRSLCALEKGAYLDLWVCQDEW